MRIKRLKFPRNFSLNVLGVDPSLSATGLCLLHHNVAKCATIYPKKNSLEDKCKEVADQVLGFLDEPLQLTVMEHMRIRSQRNQVGDPNSLVDIAVLSGYTLGLLSVPTILARPECWKGGIPKSIHHKRMVKEHPQLGKLTEHERDAFGLAIYGMDKCLSKT